MSATEKLANVREAAGRLNVPVAWLRAEATAGRVPALRVGNKLMFDMAVLREALAERAKRETVKGVRDEN